MECSPGRSAGAPCWAARHHRSAKRRSGEFNSGFCGSDHGNAVIQTADEELHAAISEARNERGASSLQVEPPARRDAPEPAFRPGVGIPEFGEIALIEHPEAPRFAEACVDQTLVLRKGERYAEQVKVVGDIRDFRDALDVASGFNG